MLSVSGSYMGNSQLVQRPGPNVQASANSYYSATSAGKYNFNLLPVRFVLILELIN